MVSGVLDNTDLFCIATSDGSNLPARIAHTVPVYYTSLQEAYNNAVNGDIIQAHAKVFIEDISINKSIAVSLEGGYDCNYIVNDGTTKVIGQITVSTGTIEIENFSIE